MSEQELEAAQAEALDESRTIAWRDLKFVIAPPNRWLMQFQHYADRDKVTRALEVALGAEQYERFIFAEPAPSPAEAAQLSNTIISAFGVDAGN